MKIVKTVAAQGDLLVIRVDSIPSSAKPATPQKGQWIVAHSETGHNHVIDRPRAEMYEAADDEFTGWIRTLGDGAEIKHLRDFDTHESLLLEPNAIYQVRRQREYVPEGWRRAAD